MRIGFQSTWQISQKVDFEQLMENQVPDAVCGAAESTVVSSVIASGGKLLCATCRSHRQSTQRMATV
jgi:hypothetical protein